MVINIRDVATTTEAIAEELNKEENDSDKKKNAAAVSSKLTYIFRKLGFKEDDMIMYRSVSDGDGIGRYMFLRNMDVIKEFFSIMDKGDVLTLKEKNRLEECLIEMIPVFNKAEDYEKFFKLEKLNKDTDKYKSEYYKLFLEDDKYDTYKERIHSIVNDYYINCMLNGAYFYEKRMFVSVDCAQKQISARCRVYYYQYTLMFNWSQKWDYIMASIKRIRNTEESDNRYELCIELGLLGAEKKEVMDKKVDVKEWKNEQAKKMYSESYWMDIRDLYEYISAEYVKEELQKQKNIETKKEGINKDDCLNKCKEEVVKICKYNNNKEFKEDFKYLIEKAFEELEVIRQKVLEKEKIEYCCSLDLETTKENFEELYKVRDAVKNKRKLITDYK